MILTWNRYRFLEACLEALLLSIANKEECEMLVLDNGSTDRTREVLDRYREGSPVRAIIRDRNYGLNAYKDLFGQAKEDYIVTVDDDVLEFPSNMPRGFRKIRLRVRLFPFSMKHGEDGFISGNLKRKLHLKSGIIKDAVCFHATGPYYAKQFGHVEREIEKYSKAGLYEFVDRYKEPFQVKEGSAESANFRLDTNAP